MPAESRSDRVLIVLHQERSSPGRIGLRLQARGFKLDIRRPRFGDALPDTMAEHAGAIVFGGPMSANDTDAFVHRETDWLAVPLREQAPLLGICLGAQMLARHMGARVGPHSAGEVEIGYYPLAATETGRRLMDWPERVYQWHTEGFEVPAGCELLATGCEAFPNQAVRFGPSAFGVQFHPELTLAQITRWTTIGHARLALPGARPRPTHFADRLVYDAAVVAWLEGFFDLWIGSRDRPPVAGRPWVTGGTPPELVGSPDR